MNGLKIQLRPPLLSGLYISICKILDVFKLSLIHNATSIEYDPIATAIATINAQYKRNTTQATYPPILGHHHDGWGLLPNAHIQKINVQGKVIKKKSLINMFR